MAVEGSAYPAYLAPAVSGELRQRARAAWARLQACHLCPRHCGINRLAGEKGFCGVGCQAVVASYGPHHGEESCLSGWRGSGTIFLSGCNLGCVFCQNWDISHEVVGQPVNSDELAAMMLELQDLGCHNINWVTPTHVLPQLLEALCLASERGLCLPIVYNSSGYDVPESLRLLEGVVDIYLPDFKMWNPKVAQKFLGTSDYPEIARQALKEMHRQVGDLVIGPDGLARRGVLLRHLVMPHQLAGTRELCEWLVREISPGMYVNLMAQYHPWGAVVTGPNRTRYRAINRRLFPSELSDARAAARAAGLRRLD